jgi:DNA polymerase III epsilon subunit-like protein
MYKQMLVVDTETTGLIDSIGGRPHYSHYKKYPRIVSIAWAIIKDGYIVDIDYYIIKPQGYNIPNSDFHGITQENAMSNGKSLEFVLNMFIIALSSVDAICAHNLEFDLNIILSEIYRCYIAERTETFEYTILLKSPRALSTIFQHACHHSKLSDTELSYAPYHRNMTAVYGKAVCSDILSKSQYCTMKNGATVLGLKKWPSLTELCKHLGVTFEGKQHNAKNDLIACAKCYLQLMQATIKN